MQIGLVPRRASLPPKGATDLADLPESAEPAPLDEEARRKLEALGYLD